MTTTAIQISTTARPTQMSLRLPDRILGLALATLVPACFWTALIARVALALGSPLRGLTLASIATLIAAFPGPVVGAIIMRP